MAISVPGSPEPVLDKNINRERITGFTVALSHSALADTAERQCRISNLQDNIVDTACYRSGLAKRLLLFRLTVRKWIDGESLVADFYNLNCILEILKRGIGKNFPNISSDIKFEFAQTSGRIVGDGEPGKRRHLHFLE